MLHAKAAGPTRLRALHKVHALCNLIFVLSDIVQREVVVGQAVVRRVRNVGRRKVLQEPFSDRVETVRGNDIAGERQAGGRIGDDVRRLH